MDLTLRLNEMNAETDRCPWCGSIIPHSKFVEVQARIREEEQKKLAVAEAALSKRLQDEFEKKVETHRRAAEKQAREEAAKFLAKASSEKELALEKLKQVEAREAETRKQALEETEKRRQLEQRHQHDLALAKQVAEKQAKEQSEKRVAALAAERDLAIQKAKQLEAKAAAVRKEAEEQAQQRFQKELNQQRLILEKAKEQEVLKKQVEFSRERESWEKKMVELQKKLQQKTANEIGEGAEVDVYEVLRQEFPYDNITRVAKGQPGADIHHEILYKGESCGLIVVDSKNRQGWQNSYITKLRQDETEAGAEQAILTTTVFPVGKKELCIESGIIVVNPARVAHIVALLRNAMIAMHRLGLSAKERSGKMDQLYNFITSEGYTKRFDEATKLTDDILELDVQEKKAHDNVWKKRGTLATRLSHVLRELDTEVSAIVEADVNTGVPAA